MPDILSADDAPDTAIIFFASVPLIQYINDYPLPCENLKNVRKPFAAELLTYHIGRKSLFCIAKHNLDEKFFRQVLPYSDLFPHTLKQRSQRILAGEFCSFKVGFLGFNQLVADDRHIPRRRNAQLHPVFADFKDRHFDIFADNKAFFYLSGYN
jgi:hypothetical protein